MSALPTFSKSLRGQGSEPLSLSAESEILPILPKTQERVNSFAEQRKRENPRRGFSLFWYKVTFLFLMNNEVALLMNNFGKFSQDENYFYRLLIRHAYGVTPSLTREGLHMHYFQL